MKSKFVFLSALILVFFTVGCSKNKSVENEIWELHFNTSDKPGICYYAYKDFIRTSNGHLTFQNRNNFTVHLLIFNKNKKGKAEYEADLEGGGILSFYNVDTNTDYSIGVRVLDGCGKEDVYLNVYGDADVIPYVLQ